MSGKTIVVTGASSGIGKEVAILLSKLGARVVITGRDLQRLEQTKNLLDQQADHIILDVDMTDTDALVGKLTTLVKTIGMLDGMIHCAGIQITAPLQFMDIEMINTMIQSNIVSAITLAKFFRQKFVAKSPSSIVFLSSVTALFGQSGLSLYAATKGAMISLTKALATELSRQKIRVNCIVPGMIDTEMTQHAFKHVPTDQQEKWSSSHLFGIGEAIDVANMAAFLVADTSKWITGSSFTVDGGFSAFKVDER
jgi:NAD(P)-dependent dehydrogenase (short-subunit alcohol dehydrogenase family)